MFLKDRRIGDKDKDKVWEYQGIRFWLLRWTNKDSINIIIQVLRKWVDYKIRSRMQ